MAFVNGGAVVSCGNVAIATAGSMLLGSSGGGGTVDLGPVRITGNLVKPGAIKSVRAISSTRLRVEFTRSVNNNTALADVNNYAVRAINSGAPITIQGVDVPNGTLVTTVDLIVSEMTQWDFIYGATYLVSINASSIDLGPQLVADWDMESPLSSNWTAQFGTTVNKVAGSPSGSGALVIEFNGGVPTIAGVKQVGILTPGAYYRISTYWRNSALVAQPCVAWADNATPNAGNPSTFPGTSFLLGTQFDTAFRYVQIDIAAVSSGLFIGRNGNGSPSSAQFDELSARRWVPTGGGAIDVTDSDGTPIISDPFGFTGVGIAPKILVAYATDKNTIVVQFTEPVLDLGSIRTVGAYTANLGLTITAVLDVGVDTVTLKTSNQTAGQLYTLTLTGNWYDAALNPLVSPSNTPVLGFVTPAVQEALLTLRMYNFLIAGLREADQTDEGARFIERFVEGPQTIWAAIIKTIFDIPKIWSTSDCPDDLLQFLKRIVGWTPDTDAITEALDFATLRRLIAASVRFWKTRGPEESIEDLLRITTGARSYVNNWFKLRFILDETYLGEEHGQGTDPWLLSTPGEGEDAWVYNVRIVDNGTLNRQLVRDVAKLTRPTGERVLITYLGFLDRFETDGDLTQWSFPNVTSITHQAINGALRFQYNGSQQEYAFVKDPDAQAWTSYVASWTFRASMNQFEFIFYGTGDPNVNNGLIDYYFVRLYMENDPFFPNRIIIAKRVAGTASTIVSTNLLTNFGERLLSDVTYTVRVEVCPTVPGSATNVINAYLDGELVLSTTDNVFSQGTLGMNIRTDQSPTLTYFDLLEMEMFFLPRSADYIDLGNVVNNAEVLRGPELMADTDFDDPASWSLSGAGMSIHDGYLEILPGFGNGRLAYQLYQWKLGDKFEFKFTISNWVADTAQARVSVFSALVDNNGTFTASGNGDYTITVTCNTAPINDQRWLALRFGDTGNMRIERLSVKQILFPTG